MKAIGRYDSALQMFVEDGRGLDYSHLTFLRWLAERNLLEHRIAGPSSGEAAEQIVNMSILKEVIAA